MDKSATQCLARAVAALYVAYGLKVALAKSRLWGAGISPSASFGFSQAIAKAKAFYKVRLLTLSVSFTHFFCKKDSREVIEIVFWRCVIGPYWANRVSHRGRAPRPYMMPV